MIAGTPDINTPLVNNPNVVIAKRPGLSYFKISINYSKGPWTNVKFRQAMNYAVDREAIAQALFHGQSEVAWMPYPTTMKDQYTPALAKKYAYNVAKAKALIAESGLATPIKTSAVVPAGVISYQRFGEIVQAQFAAVGVDLSLNPSTDLLRDYRTDQKYDISMTSWAPRPDPTATIQRQFGPNQLQNSGNYTNPQLDAALAKMRSSTDPKIQKQGYDDANTIVVDNGLEIAVAFAEISYPHRTRVVGDVNMNETCQGVDMATLAIAKGKT
jgi:ABC-type transport system substrate-binding protein